MTDAVITATYADWQTVKTRKVLKLIFEIPLEKQAEVLAVLGAPMPDAETWVGIALLKEQPVPQEKAADKPRAPFADMSRAQQAGMLCNDATFQMWMLGSSRMDIEGTNKPDLAAAAVRDLCRVTSRAELNTDMDAGQLWDNAVSAYRADTGQTAEER